MAVKSGSLFSFVNGNTCGGHQLCGIQTANPSGDTSALNPNFFNFITYKPKGIKENPSNKFSWHIC
jgi:hypothetical protein